MKFQILALFALVSPLSCLVLPPTESVQPRLKLQTPAEGSLTAKLHGSANQEHPFDQAISRASDTFGSPQSSPPLHPNPANQTVFEILSSSKHTRILVEYIKEDAELVRALNSTADVHTVFAPVDDVLKVIPHQRQVIKNLLRYHITPHSYTLKTLACTRTIPTLAEAKGLCKGVFCPARLTVGRGPAGISINAQPLIVNNVFGTNGVIHGIDAVLMPPSDVLEYLDLNPTQFSTFDLAMDRTNLRKSLADVKKTIGGTWFVPTNGAWLNLGQDVVNFLFSPDGHPFLRRILEYHIVPYWTMFSNGIYPLQEDGEEGIFGTVPDGRIQIELPTLHPNHTMLVDLASYGCFSEIRINTYDVVAQPDIFANDAVLHVVDNVLFPPNKLKLPRQKLMAVEDIKEIWAEYVYGVDDEDPVEC